jgi:predicted peptidase
LHGGSSLWTSHFEWNPLASWAGKKYQSQFKEGGAFIIVPRANEDLRDGHGLTWNDAHVEPLFLAIEDFLDKHPNADRSRVYVGGYSMGGGMTWLMLRARPDYFAAAVPCCPTISYLPAEDELPKFAKLPVWTIVGKGDTGITNAVLKIMPELLKNAKSAGTDTRFLELPKGYKMPDGKSVIPNDHCVWIPMFNNLLYDDGKPYADLDGVTVQSTLTDWLNNV